MGKLRKIRLVLALAVLVAIPAGFNACNSTMNAYAPPVETKAVSNIYQVSPTSANVFINQQTTFTVTGGHPPYQFSKTKGYGDIDFNTGVFTASGYSGTTEIMIADSSGQILLASAVTTGGPMPSPTPTILGPPTNCSAMPSQPYTAYGDSSVNGLLNVGATAMLTDVNSCASWCSSIGAGTCEWSQNSNNPVCVAWRPGESIFQYPTDHNSWNVYSLSCPGAAGYVPTCLAGNYTLSFSPAINGASSGSLWLGSVANTGAITGIFNIPGHAFQFTGSCANGNISMSWSGYSCTGSYSGTSFSGSCTGGTGLTWSASP